MSPKIFYSTVTADTQTPARWVMFLHGILGSGANWRSFARGVVQSCPDWGAVLVDLRMHGQSQDFDPPHTLAACAEDLIEQVSLPVQAVVGHSFGGKVALTYAAMREQLGVALNSAVTVDSNPGVRDDSASSDAILSIVSALEALPRPLASREQAAEQLRAHGISPSLVAWLMMNVRPISNTQQVELRLNLQAIRAMLKDYFAVDAWDMVERSSTQLTLVVGGTSPSYSVQDRARAHNLAAAQQARLSTVVIEEAGHWVHVDAPERLANLVIDVLRKTQP
jgi:pimeloyl-ACP methyl ester carboxylesterase